jgi:hypothetical protein
MGNCCPEPELPQYCPKFRSTLLLSQPMHAIRYMPDTKFFIRYGDLYIVESSGIPENCTVCGWKCPNEVSLCRRGGTQDIYAAYDGKTRLPMQIYALNADSFIKMEHYDVPNFGSILLQPGLNFVMCNPYKKISKTKYYNSLDGSSVFMIDGELAVCCLTRENRCIVVNMAGNILDMEVINYAICGGGAISINTSYGLLSAFRIYNYDYTNWSFNGTIPAPKIRGSRTKPASREINYS